ncbi:MAG: tetratricopeptide repeat protein [Balneola sp.]
MNSKISTLAQQVKKNPDDSFSKFALALELLKVNQQEKALSLFKNIQLADPDYVGVYYHLGKLYEELGKNNLALSCYKDGIVVTNRLKSLHAKSELQGALINLEMELEDNL